MSAVFASIAAPSRSLLQRFPRSPVLLLILLPFVAHLPQWLLPIHNDPFWQFSYLTHGMAHTWLPGQAYLDPYIAFTSDSFGPLIALDWFHGILPWWNPYVGIGVPLAGQMQPGAFFLPFVLLLALPGGITLLAISIQIVCGLSTYALLRELSLTKLAAFIGGSLYALNGTIAWAPGPAAVFCTLAFLPLLLWGIERARAPNQGALSTLAIGVAIAWSLFAGFPETAYLGGMLALAWAVFRVIGSAQRWMLANRIIFGGALGLLFAAPLLIAFAHELGSADTLTGHVTGFSIRPIRALSMLLMPYVYGPPNSGTANGAGMAAVWGGIGGYTSALIAFFAVLAFTARAPHKGLRLLLLGSTLLSLAKTFGFPPAMAILNALPMMKLMSFDRYAAPCWELPLIILAAFGFDSIRHRRGLRLALVITLGLVIPSMVLAWPARHWSSSAGRFLSEMLIVGGLWAIALPILAWLAGTRLNLRHARVTAARLLLTDAIVLFCFPQFAGFTGGEIDLSVVQFLKAHVGLSRVVTLGPLTPNYGAHFGFAELNHNMSPMPQVWIDHINTRLLPNFTAVDGGVTFWPVKGPPLDTSSAILALNEHLSDYQDLNVRYVVTGHGQSLNASIQMPKPAGKEAVLDLTPGQTASIRVQVPKLKQPIRQIGVFIGTYAGKADGDLSVQVCAESDCRTAQGPLGAAADNDFYFLTLNPPLPVENRKELSLQMTHQGGSSRVALWIWPGQAGDAQLMPSPKGATQLAFRDDTQTKLVNRVFQSQVADVWELPSPQPYFDAGGACQLNITGREDLTADCKQPANLIRRELYMTGWNAKVNGQPAPVRRHGEVLQEITLPAGHSITQFHFTPPYMGYGWLAFTLGAVGLMWQALKAAKNPI